MELQETLGILQQGEISLNSQFLWGSNYTFAVDVTHQGQTLQAVYKPTRGERPLWDFPTDSLALREVAAFVVSEQLNWRLVPPTVYRKSGPYGAGSLQLHIDHDPEYHYFNFSPEDRARLRPVVLFDIIANNTDRKGGHVIVDPENHIWGIDHGICFHEDWKLRTVLWHFAGERLPDDLCGDLHNYREHLAEKAGFSENLLKYLSQREINAMIGRINRIVSVGVFPQPPSNTRPYPWPLV